MRKIPLLFALCFLSSALPSHADVPIPLANVPVPDQLVGAVAMTSSTIYIGGNFTHISAYTGGAVIVNTQTGSLQPPYPQVNGNVYAMVGDGSGGYYIGGSFTQVGTIAINGLAHILSNGTLDINWNPSPGPAGDPNFAIYSLVLNGSTLYVGGSFLSMGSQTRNHIAALNVATAIPTSWNPNADYSVYAMSLSGSVLYVGGAFANIGGQARTALAAVDTASGLATTWNADVQGNVIGTLGSRVESMLLTGSTLYIGGDFSSAGGQPRQEIAALNTATALATSWNPGADDQVSCFLLSGSTLYVGGWFRNIAGQARGAIASFNQTTGALNSWNPNAQFLSENTATSVLSMLLSGSNILAAGRFDTIGGQSRANLAAVDTTSGNATSWNPNINSDVYALVLNGTSLYVGGVFFSAGPTTARRYAAAFDLATGNILSWNPNPDSGIGPILINGSVIYVGGTFTTIGGQARNGLAALDAVTGNALSWNPNPSGGNLTGATALAVSGSTLYVGGSFTTIGGQSRNGLAAVDTVSGNATSWNPSLTNPNPQPPIALALLLTGTTLYVGGTFQTAQGLARNSLAAFNTTNNTLLPWNPNPQTTITGYSQASIEALATNGSVIYAGGDFTSIGGQSRNLIAALDTNVGNATSWNPNIWYNPPPPEINDSSLYALQLSGSVLYAAGEFNSVGGVPMNYTNLVALDTTTGVPLTWSPNPNNPVFALALNKTTLSVGGTYQVISGTNRGYFNEFAVSGAANPPVITSKLTATGVTGSTFSYQITATNSPTSYGATPLPGGLTVTATNGLISGTPTTYGISNVTLSANNSAGQGTANLVMTIYSACDANQDNVTNVVDVQLEVNMSLGITACTADINKDGVCNVVDVQRVVNAAVGGSCVTGP